jgi:hypothetical protein
VSFRKFTGKTRDFETSLTRDEFHTTWLLVTSGCQNRDIGGDIIEIAIDRRSIVYPNFSFLNP